MTETLRNRATSRRLIPLIAAAIALSVGAGTARAQSIANLSIAKGGTNSADENSSSTANPRFDRRSAVTATPTSGTSFSARYSFEVAADYDGFQILGASRTESLTAAYTISFQASAPGAYRLNVSTSLQGDINRIADGGGGNAQGSVGATSGSQTGGTIASGSLALGDPADLGNAGGAGNVVINQTGSAVITGVSNGSPVNHTLTFSGFNPSVNSAVGIFGTNAPEVAVRGGISSPNPPNISAGQYPGSPSRASLATDGHSVTVTLTSLCGNGVVDAPFEQCDLSANNGSGTSCCTSSCQFRASGQQCRAEASICDGAESCTGSAATCPTDIPVPASANRLCRASATECDVDDFCDGTNFVCGTDNVVAANVRVCRPTATVCDVDDYCDGSSHFCGADNVVAAGIRVCRPEATICDADDYCDGSSHLCGADNVVAAGTRLCRAASDLCDEDDYCDGADHECVVENISPTTKLCRPVSGECDAADFCDGTNKPCPTDTVLPTSVMCRGAAGVCDVDDFCPGNAPTCSTDNRKPNTTSCRAVADDCDIEDFCDGSVDCPADVVKPDDDNDGLCDEQDNCPADSDPTFADDDGDGRGNVCDACTNIGPVDIVNPVIQLKRIHTPTSDDTLKFTGQVTVPTTPPIDPVAKGVRFRFEDPDGAEVLDVTIPGGAYNAALRYGWKATTAGWKYKNVGRIVPPIKGIGNITLTKDKVVPGRIKFKFTGKKGFYPVFSDDLPLKVSFVVDSPTAETGQCGESSLTSAECLFDAGHTKLQCENPN